MIDHEHRFVRRPHRGRPVNSLDPREFRATWDAISAAKLLNRMAARSWSW